MSAKVMLCIDEESARRPELIGLAGEDFLSQAWLSVETNAQSARETARSNVSFEEIWVASCDDVEPVNVAAAIKRDNPRRWVGLLSAQPTGSLQSRISAAGIDAVMSHQALSERYAFWKERSRNALGQGGESRFGQDGQVRLRGKEASRLEAGAGGKATTPEVAVCAERGARSASAASHARAFVLTVASGSGGSGKSAVAATIAAIAAACGRNTLLLDADLQFGDMREAFSAERAFGIDEMLAGSVGAGDLPRKEGEPCILAAPRHLEQSEALSAQVGGLLDSLSDRFDVIVANTGSSWGEHHAALLERSSKALFLVDQRASSLRACKHALELCSRCGIASTPFFFAVNRCSKRSPFSSLDVSCALQGASVVELADGGFEVEEMVSSGLACELARSRNAFAQSVRDLVDAMLPNALGAEGPAFAGDSQPKGFFARRGKRGGGKS